MLQSLLSLQVSAHVPFPRSETPAEKRFPPNWFNEHIDFLEESNEVEIAFSSFLEFSPGRTRTGAGVMAGQAAHQLEHRQRRCA
jgi:hypothetical protein